MKFQILFILSLSCLISCTSTRRSMSESDPSQRTDKSNVQNRVIQSENPYNPEIFTPADGNLVNQPKPDKIDLADFYFSKKQYNESFDIYSEALLDNAIKISSERWLQSAIRSIVVAVKVKKDQSLALELVSALFDSKAIPAAHKMNARYWQKSLKNWRNEDDSAANYTQAKSSKLLMQTEKSLNEMKLAKNSKEYFLVDRLKISATLEYLMSKGNLDKKEKELLASLAEVNSAKLNEIGTSGPVLRTY